MKKSLLIVLATTFTTTSAFAQTTTGEGAAAQTKAAAKSNWQKWAFGISAIVIAVAAITVVCLDQGSSPQSH